MVLEPEPLRYIGHLYRRAQQRHAAVWTRNVSDTTTSVQFAVLTVVDQHPEASQRDVGIALELDRSTIADLTLRMIRRGLLDRSRSAEDRRRSVLRLTESGRTELGRLRPRVQAIESALTNGLSDDERAELHRLLRVVLSPESRTTPLVDKVTANAPVVGVQAAKTPAAR